MEKENYIFGITLTDDFKVKDYADFLKKEYDLSPQEIKELKPAYLFKLSNNIQFWCFDADIVLLSKKKETFYPTGNSVPISKIEDNKEIVALVDENSEVLLL